jgi:hypothetical protein
MLDINLDSLWQYRGFGIEWYYAIFYYIFAVPSTFMLSSLITETLMRSISKVVCRLNSKQFLWALACHAMYSLSILINKWIWPIIIIYLHYGVTALDYISVTGTITVALYALWAKLHSDVADVYKAAEKQYNLR